MILIVNGRSTNSRRRSHRLACGSCRGYGQPPHRSVTRMSAVRLAVDPSPLNSRGYAATRQVRDCSQARTGPATTGCYFSRAEENAHDAAHRAPSSPPRDAPDGADPDQPRRAALGSAHSRLVVAHDARPHVVMNT